MAVAFRAATIAGNYAGTSIVATTPTGTADGDWLFAFQNIDAADFTSVPVPSGWTQLAQQLNAASDTTSSQRLLRRAVTTADNPASHTFTKPANRDCIVALVAVSGGHASTAPVTATTRAAASTSSHAAPSVTPADAESLLLVGVDTYYLNGALAGGWTGPGGMTERAERNDDGYIVLAVYSQTLASSAATGTRTVTHAFGRSQPANAITVAVPAAATAPPATGLLVDAWNGTALVRQTVEAWDGTALVPQVVDS